MTPKNPRSCHAELVEASRFLGFSTYAKLSLAGRTKSGSLLSRQQGLSTVKVITPPGARVISSSLTFMLCKGKS